MMGYPSSHLSATQRFRHSTSIKAALRRGLQPALTPASCLFRRPSYQVALMTLYCCWEKLTLAVAPCRQLSSGAISERAFFFLPEMLFFPLVPCQKMWEISSRRMAFKASQNHHFHRSVSLGKTVCCMYLQTSINDAVSSGTR